jgi:hypothetical protein
MPGALFKMWRHNYLALFMWVVSFAAFATPGLPFEPILKYTFPGSECSTTGVFPDRRGSGPSITKQSGANCVTKTLTGIGATQGVEVATCTTPNTFASAPFTTQFDSYNVQGNLNITFEIWFSLTESIPTDELFTYFLLEISKHTTFLTGGANSSVSLDEDDTQVFIALGRTVLPDDNLFVSPAFSIAALQSAGGFCEKSDANTIFTSDESAGFKPLLDSATTTVDRMYKMMVTIGSFYPGVVTIYLSTGDDSSVVEYAVPFPALLLYNVSPVRLQIIAGSRLRLGCSVQNEPAFPGVFYRVVVYDRALNIEEAELSFNTV